MPPEQRFTSPSPPGVPLHTHLPSNSITNSGWDDLSLYGDATAWPPHCHFSLAAVAVTASGITAALECSAAIVAVCVVVTAQSLLG